MPMFYVVEFIYKCMCVCVFVCVRLCVCARVCVCVCMKAEDVFWQQTDFCDKIFHSERKGLNVLDNSVGYRQLAEKSCMDLEI